MVVVLAAVCLVAFGSLMLSQPVTANGDANQCGTSAVDALDLPADATADVSGETCLVLARRQVRDGYVALAAACGLAGLIVVRTKDGGTA